MHIPDGYLDPAWVAATYAAVIGYFGVMAKKFRPVVTPEAAVLAAGIFVAQMLNWPLPGGTSLHLVGGALAAAILGPWSGSVVMGLVVTIQCLLFHDGGITALGANLLNMAVIDVLVGYAVFKTIRSRVGGVRGLFLGGLLGGWTGIVAAGVACGIEIGLSPQWPFGVAVTVPIMGGWHAILGIVEGIITGSVLAYLGAKAPEVIKG